MARRRRRGVMSEELKYKLAKDLGFYDTVQKEGWGGIRAKDAGNMVKRALQIAEKALAEQYSGAAARQQDFSASARAGAAPSAPAAPAGSGAAVFPAARPMPDGGRGMPVPAASAAYAPDASFGKNAPGTASAGAFRTPPPLGYGNVQTTVPVQYRR